MPSPVTRVLPWLAAVAILGLAALVVGRSLLWKPGQDHGQGPASAARRCSTDHGFPITTAFATLARTFSGSLVTKTTGVLRSAQIA